MAEADEAWETGAETPGKGPMLGWGRKFAVWLRDKVGAILSPSSESSDLSTAIIALAAKLSVADGVSASVELETFERVFNVPADELKQVRRFYNLARKSTAGYQAYADRIAKLLKDEPAMKGDIFDGLLAIAAADGIMHPGEDAFLRDVAKRLGLAGQDYEAIRARYIRDANSAFIVLGLTPEATNEEVKQRHRELAMQFHPDRAIATRSVQAEVTQAEARLMEVNAAFDRIMRDRGLKSVN